MIALVLALAVAFPQFQACARCHAAEAGMYAKTAMAHALEIVRDCAILKAHPTLTFREGRYSYSIVRRGEASIYTVTDGTETIAVPIGWAFGNGSAGQTYVFERDGALYESRVSFYNAADGLDLTMGARNSTPASIGQAVGRRMDSGDVQGCFGCHSTGAGKPVDLKALVPGVGCERCHGSAVRHLAALEPMPTLSTISTEEISNLCGGCHRTWEEIAASGPHGPLNVRFQPYRLTNSKCYDASDRRIACTACHNPHDRPVRDTAFYDARCKACHAAANARARACTVAARNCTGCHMPKVELPGAHFAFTDHWIRIARRGEAYPN